MGAGDVQGREAVTNEQEDIGGDAQSISDRETNQRKGTRDGARIVQKRGKEETENERGGGEKRVEDGC